MDIKTFAQNIINWQKQHGRHTLPWQNTKGPYRIWLSEVMLQQTQVATVIPYYQRFLKRFPSINDLAAAPLDTVMPYWAGLGYYARARNLHRCAQQIVSRHQGRFPTDAATLATLPGIGRTTAAAIAAFAFNEITPILDGNVKRIFARYFGIATPLNRSQTEKQLWVQAEQLLQVAQRPIDMAAYTQGLMDLGAMICSRTKPDCGACPLQQHCYAFQHQQQDRLPVRAATKKKPKRSKAALVLQAGSEIFLQQQAAPGIWGGLWSVPTFDKVVHLEHFIDQHLSVSQPNIQSLATIKHSFTHFDLTIQPVWVRIEEAPATLPVSSTKKRAWVPVTNLTAQALPAPIKKLFLSQEFIQLATKSA